MKGRRRLGIRLALIGIVTFATLFSAALIHGSWQRTAGRNVRELVDLVNVQTVASINREVTQVLANAEAAREALRSMFFQGAIAMADEARREFVFLALLQSQSSLSWIAFGWPNGDFFGAQKVGDGEIRMVEVRRTGAGPLRERRIDTYDALAGDIVFRRRETADSTFDASAQPWYRDAIAADAPVWSETTTFPTRVRPGVGAATPLDVYKERVGVIGVMIEFERLSRFLTGLAIGRTGAAYILAPDGRVLAAPIDPAAHPLPEDELPPWQRLDTSTDPLLRAAAHGWADLSIGSAGIAGPRQVEVTSSDGRRYLVGFSPLPFGRWVVATVIPTDDFLGDIERNTRMLYVAVAILVLLVAAVGALIADRLISRPLRRLARQLEHVEAFRLDRIAAVPSPLREVADLSATIAQMARGLSSFRKFLPVDLVRRLVAQGVEARPGGIRQDLTVLFADLAGFTSLSERLGEAVVPMLAAHLDRMSSVIHSHHGTIDKFIGDAVMAFWNAPEPAADHALKACRAALAAQKATASRGMGLRMRIGINSGTVLVGNIGAEDRLNYTAIGDPVNLASRLEALNKVYGTEIIIGEATRGAAGDGLILRELDTVVVYGRAMETRVYELLGIEAEDEPMADIGWIATYEAALAAYRDRQWDLAIGLFEAVIAARGGDRPSAVLAGRCRQMKAAEPDAGWTGASVLESK